MSTTVILTGMLPFIVLAASILAIPVSLLLLRIYKSAVKRGMIAGGSAPTESARNAGMAAPTPLQFVSLAAKPDNGGKVGASSTARLAQGARWRTAGVYVAAGACYAAIMTAALLLSDPTQAIGPTKIAFVFWTYLWPAVPSVLLVAAYDGRRRMQVIGLYFAVFIAIVAVGVARNPGIGFLGLFRYWTIENGPATVLMMAFLYRPIRAVGPLVLSFLTAVAVGSTAILTVANKSDGFLRGIVKAGTSAGLSVSAIFVGMIVVGMAMFALLVGWPTLRYLGRRYEDGKLSDQSLTVDAVWLLFSVVQSVFFAFEGPLWVLAGVVAFVTYKVATRAGFRWMGLARRQRESKTLLLLRVFALGKRSELFFDRLRKHWQYVGGTLMIAGPDLVTTMVEPHEFMDFLRGRLGRRFVSSPEDVERRLATLDKLPDPDGRFRIAEFFCHNNTWQMTMGKLAASSDVVLMDLRSFSVNNDGCLYELGRLLDSVDLRRVVFLVDGTTERRFLESTVQKLWQQVGEASPNRATPGPELRVFTVSRQDEGELGALVGHLLSAA